MPGHERTRTPNRFTATGCTGKATTGNVNTVTAKNSLPNNPLKHAHLKHASCVTWTDAPFVQVFQCSGIQAFVERGQGV